MSNIDIFKEIMEEEQSHCFYIVIFTKIVPVDDSNDFSVLLDHLNALYSVIHILWTTEEHFKSYLTQFIENNKLFLAEGTSILYCSDDSSQYEICYKIAQIAKEQTCYVELEYKG